MSTLVGANTSALIARSSEKVVDMIRCAQKEN